MISYYLKNKAALIAPINTKIVWIKTISAASSISLPYSFEIMRFAIVGPFSTKVMPTIATPAATKTVSMLPKSIAAKIASMIFPLKRCKSAPIRLSLTARLSQLID